MPTRSCVILGAGGHASVVLDALQLSCPELVIEVWDDDSSKAGARLLDVAVKAPIGAASGLRRTCHVAIGDNTARGRLGEAVASAGGSLLAIVHPAAQVSRHAVVEDGVFVAAQAVVAPQVRLGRGAIVNHAAVVDHDCQVGMWTHIAPGAILGGGVRIGEHCLIGSGAVILMGVSVGDGAIVGSGAVVLHDVPARETVVGVPARRRDAKR
jgi:sugar O-acyltransferase (sialic acid O-acetyltransferase NeuD family)